MRGNRSFSLNLLIPNIVTLFSLCVGLSAVRFSFDGKQRFAVMAILISAILDGLDGRIARLIGATSRFGSELDSLADFACFGVVPGLLLYISLNEHDGRFVWIAVLIYTAAMALRLARFNTALDSKVSTLPWQDNYFVGVPAPAGAGLALLPIIFGFEFKEITLPSSMVSLWLIVVASLVVSRVPTFSIKKLRITPDWILSVMLGAVVLVAGLVVEPWLTLICCGLLYLLSIPAAIYLKHKSKTGKCDSDVK